MTGTKNVQISEENGIVLPFFNWGSFSRDGAYILQQVVLYIGKTRRRLVIFTRICAYGKTAIREHSLAGQPVPNCFTGKRSGTFP